MSQPRHSCVGPYLRSVSASIALLLLAGCATAADPERMAVTQGVVTTTFPVSLQHTMCVRNVSGGEETNPLWFSQVGNAGFREALINTLSDTRLLSPENSCKYLVDVNLLGMSQPTAGFAMEVTAHANYKVYDSAGKPVLLETISAAYTAEISESIIGVIRLKRANEGAIRASISQFLEKLRKIK